MDLLRPGLRLLSTWGKHFDSGTLSSDVAGLVVNMLWTTLMFWTESSFCHRAQLLARGGDLFSPIFSSNREKIVEC